MMNSPANFDALLVEQIEDGEQIQRMLTNFKKAPKGRNTPARLTKISEELCLVWNVVVERHSKLLEFECFKLSSYAEDKKFDDIEKAKESLSELISIAQKDTVCSPPFEEDLSENHSNVRSTYLKLLRNYLDKYETPNLDLLELDLEFDLSRMDRYYSLFKSAHDMVTQYPSSSALTKQLIEEYSSLTDRFQEVAVRVERAILEANETPKTSFKPHVPVEHAPTSSIEESLRVLAEILKQTARPSHPAPAINLPKISLATFDGTSSQWPEFKELFESMIHTNAKLSVIEKMHYLKSSLKGAAAEPLKHMRLSQYEEAWNLITRRYNNCKVLTYDCLKRLFAIKSVNMERPSDLRQLIDSTKEIIYSLRSLGEPVDAWNSIFVYSLSHRLPSESFAIWEQSLGASTVIPNFAVLDDFIESRINTLMSMDKKPIATITKAHAVSTKSVQRDPCTFCGKNHPNYKCSNLTQLTAVERLALIKAHKLCELCFQSHPVAKCKYTWRCRLCKGLHNSMIHIEQLTSNCAGVSTNGLLPTAIIRIVADNGATRFIRALIDTGSMGSFISESIVQGLNLQRKHYSAIVEGIGGKSISARGKAKFYFNSIFEPNKQFEVEAIVLPKLTNCSDCTVDLPLEFDGLQLADKTFYRGGLVDAILGVDLYASLVMDGVINSVLLAQKTHVGWILSGSVTGNYGHIGCYTVSNEDVDKTLRRFWETEEKITDHPPFTFEQLEAEEIYVNTTYRDGRGRYICRLPLKHRRSFGESRRSALGSFYQLEKRFKKDPTFKAKYVACIKDYFSRGHAVSSIPSSGDQYFIPHLAVVKEDSLTTKTRVVFNASNKTTNGKSLNDNLLVGPVVQRDLVEKILRFRMHRFAFICDIEKMYRQIGIHHDDWKYQQFVWRESEDEPVKNYSLTTVTFGQASAPFTATRTLQQLSLEVQECFPLASLIIREAYVDDLHFGADRIDTLRQGAQQLIKALHSAQFNLRKWASNEDGVTEDLPNYCVNSDVTIKFMGLVWDRQTDHLSYPKPSFKIESIVTKRELLSLIAQIFDPMGWIQPVVLPAKLLMQSLWKQDLAWGDVIPRNYIEVWNDITKSLNQVAAIKIPRWCQLNDDQSVELHGFCDASQLAYGAVIYIKTPFNINLLCAKSRVAPLTNVSIPRLELMSAVLLSELMRKIVGSFTQKNISVYGWTDSKVSLFWMKADPYKWKPFVRNRVATIQEQMGPDKWAYVRSEDNPADLVSRGCDFEALMTSKLWFNGPAWLSSWKADTLGYEAHPTETDVINIEGEATKATVSCAAYVPPPTLFDDIISRFSSYNRLCRVIAWITRFYNKLKGLDITDENLTDMEVWDAERRFLAFFQNLHFPEEIESLSKKKAVSPKSTIANLVPFLDLNGLLRVGGRLENSIVEYNQKHPLIISAKGHEAIISSLILKYHYMALHGGAQQTLATLRKKYWLIGGISAVKRALRTCIICFKCRPILAKQLMANLPPARVAFTKPFLNCGLDFAGPITLKSQVGRGTRRYKGYLAVFVCFSTKAIHVEVVTALSADALIAALRRFTSIRGTVAHIYSDNGTNMVGAFRKLEKMKTLIDQFPLKWSFIPPASPHFGGLWEAGVKSVKTHLRKVLAEAVCTYEEMVTVTHQIMACLNSRPLSPLSNEISDLTALTPNHFLTGQQYFPIGEDDKPTSSGSRWQYLQSLYHHFHKRYMSEYLCRLQQRPKWTQKRINLEPGQLVLVKEDTISSSRWPLGRVTEVHAGTDGLVRVVTVATKDGIKKRPVTKIALLPSPIGE